MGLVFEKKLHNCVSDFRARIATIDVLSALETLRLEFLASKGKLAFLTEEFKLLPSEEKKRIGGLLQDAKRTCLELFDQKKVLLEKKDMRIQESLFFDPSLNKKDDDKKGNLHPYTHLTNLVEDIFLSLGFEVVSGPVVEDEYYNFTALNIPEEHPARATHDTFWLAEKGKLLRTHTSSVQIREAKKRKPPFGIVCPGRVYRNEATDASHDFMFWQLEGLYVARDASIAQLLFVLKRFLQMLFDKEALTIRTRPSYFPFVEPGLEFDMSCPFCIEGCSTCKKTRWIEIGGAGMVHPHVLKAMNVDYPTYTGFAFGLGLTRLAMLKYQISDIRLLHQPSINVCRR